MFFGLDLRNQKGLSLLDVVVAIFIIIVGLVGILSLINHSLGSSSRGKNEIVASFLAQEGIEMIRLMRSANADWADWYNSVNDGNYRVQYSDNYLMSYSDVPLKVDPNNGLHNYNAGSDSIFHRRINLVKISSDEIKVISEIKWFYKGQWYYLVVEDRLWKWQ
jgi:hypothetical protein